MKAVVYNPVEKEARERPERRNLRKTGSEKGLLSEVKAIDPSLARKSGIVLSDLAENPRATRSVVMTLESLLRGEISPAAAERRVCEAYRQNLPESVPVEGAIERLH